jgi:nitrogen-specific signal transduction histidine kinase
VQFHNGRIEFESEVGRGTTFRVELPLARLAEAPAKKTRDFAQPFAEEKR